MNDCGCCITEDDLVIVCPKHYRDILLDSNIQHSLLTDKKTHKELTKIFGIPIVET